MTDFQSASNVPAAPADVPSNIAPHHDQPQQHGITYEQDTVLRAGHSKPGSFATKVAVLGDVLANNAVDYSKEAWRNTKEIFSELSAKTKGHSTDDTTMKKEEHVIAPAAAAAPINGKNSWPSTRPTFDEAASDLATHMKETIKRVGKPVADGEKDLEVGIMGKEKSDEKLPYANAMEGIGQKDPALYGRSINADGTLPTAGLAKDPNRAQDGMMIRDGIVKEGRDRMANEGGLAPAP